MLRPCPACQRHIQVVDVTCSFCGAAVAAPEVRSPVAHAGRLSRALVFAGAIMAAPACGPSVRYESLPVAAATGEVRGHVMRHDGKPAAGTFVNLYAEGRDSTSVPAAADGSFSFANLPPGRYRIVANEQVEHFDVRAGQVAVWELELDKPKPVDTRHMAKPYGAPPARRRVV